MFLHLAVLFSIFSANAATERPSLLTGLPKNAADSFTGKSLILLGAGFAASAIIIPSGLDAKVHDFFEKDRNQFAYPGVYLGSGMGALFTAVPLYAVGYINDDFEAIGAAAAVVQATVITLATTTVLKAITGRAKPDNDSSLSTQEQAEGFRWGIGRGGVFAGWPSGHVAHTTAVTSALAHYYPEKKWLTWTAVALSSYMVVTVSSWRYGQMHWFSEAVTGAFTGYAIGSTVGKNLRSQIRGEKTQVESVSWAPILTPNSAGIFVRAEW